MMAYNNYFPATYQPMYYPMQQAQQTQQPTSLIWVGGLTEAQAYPVAPNNAVALWDSASPAIYLKQCDASGRPTIKVYDIVERVGDKPDKNTEYATKSELALFRNAIEAFKGELDTIKGDVYGLAGKKRVKKDAEDE